MKGKNTANKKTTKKKQTNKKNIAKEKECLNNRGIVIMKRKKSKNFSEIHKTKLFLVWQRYVDTKRVHNKCTYTWAWVINMETISFQMFF